jgi:hypothetical protein
MQVRTSASRRPWLRAVTALAAGSVLAASALLNAGTASAAVNPAINITAMSLHYGSTAGGTTLLITGSGFLSDADIADVTNVTFGGTDADAVIILTDTSMAAIAPTHAAGAGSVVISDGTGGGGDTSADTVNDNFTFLAPLTASVTASTLLNPNGATFLNIGGASFASAADLTTAKVTATIGGAAAAVTWVNATTVKLAVPAGTPSATPTNIVLLTNGVAGPASTDATYAAVIKSLSVTSGSIAGGGTVAVTGKGFTGGGTWLFGATAATCTLGSGSALLIDTTASCTVPAHAAGAVSVSFDPAGAIPFGTIPGGTYTYTDIA